MKANRRTRKAARQVGYAVIGLGHIAQTAVLPAFAHAGNARLAALVSDDEAKREKLSRKYRVPAAGYDDLEQVLAAEDVQAAYIAVPNDRHAELAVRCAQAGVHVLCEKPLAISEEECRRIISACEAAGVKLMTAYRLHYEPANLEVVRLIEEGAIGEPRLFDSSFSYQVKENNIRTSAERGGGPIWDIGIYCLNAARYVFRDDPVAIAALRADRRDDPRFAEVHEGMSVLLKFPGDRLASFNVSFGAGVSGSYHVVGTEGDLRLDNAYEYQGKRSLTVNARGRTRRRSFAESDQFAPELIAFSGAVLDDGDVEADGDEGLRDVRVIDALLRSAREGRVIRLAWTPRRRRPEPRDAMRLSSPGKVQAVHAEGAVDE
ncbi:MAG TPA: Gfo/Idh/MocA family oxidoreductase [Myxococcales bacterium]|nr:Gfo/Idh/MocA family oxidoreductase [Myxococcales bacterium]